MAWSAGSYVVHHQGDLVLGGGCGMLIGPATDMRFAVPESFRVV